MPLDGLGGEASLKACRCCPVQCGAPRKAQSRCVQKWDLGAPASYLTQP